MAELAAILSAAQLAASVVIPVGIELLPKIWRKIVKILKGMKIKESSAEDHANLSIIHTTMRKLERLPDLSWPHIPNASSLLPMLQSLAESLKTMIDKYVPWNPKKRISERIKSIAVTLQILDNDEGLELYQKRKENLFKDLLDILSKDNLLFPEEDYNNKSMVTTFPGIRYVLWSAQGYSRTLTISSSVLECIEHVLRWLRDFKLCGTVRGSMDVALYEVFTEILPQALMEHLGRSRYRLDQAKIKQFLANVCFLRSFSRSSTFREIQGEAGLKLDDEEKIDVDLLDARWTTWDDLQQRIDSNNRTSTFEVAETSSRRESLPTGSASELQYLCDHCNIYIRGNNVDRVGERHSIECRSKCLVCPALIGHLSLHDQQVHINACLDSDFRDRRETHACIYRE